MALETLEILDPTPEREASGRPLAAAMAPGARIALVDIRKPRGDIFLDELERLLAERGSPGGAHHEANLHQARAARTCAARSPPAAKR